MVWFNLPPFVREEDEEDCKEGRNKGEEQLDYHYSINILLGNTHLVGWFYEKEVLGGGGGGGERRESPRFRHTPFFTTAPPHHCFHSFPLLLENSYSCLHKSPPLSRPLVEREGFY